MVHVEESLQLPRDFEGLDRSAERKFNPNNTLQASEKKAMMRNGQMELE